MYANCCKKHPKYRITGNRKRYFVFDIEWNQMNRVDWKKLCKGLKTCWRRQQITRKKTILQRLSDDFVAAYKNRECFFFLYCFVFQFLCRNDWISSSFFVRTIYLEIELHFLRKIEKWMKWENQKIKMKILQTVRWGANGFQLEVRDVTCQGNEKWKTIGIRNSIANNNE